MIVRMKKVTMAVSNRDKDNFLNSLRKEGLLHIKHLTTPVGLELTQNEERIHRIEKAINILSQFAVDDIRKPIHRLDELEVVHIIQEIFTLEQEREDLEKAMQEERESLSWFKQWGKFSLEDLLSLRENGIYLKLYVLNKSQFRKIKNKENVFVIKTQNGYFYIACIFYKEEEALPYDEIKLPPMGFNEAKTKLEEASRRYNEIIEQLREYVIFQRALETFAQNLRKKHHFLEVFFGMQKEEGFSLIQGYCPEPEIYRIISLADKNGAGYLIEDPGPNEEPPTLIKNPKWISIISPVFKFLNTLPGYREFDISPVFLLFFSLFFAIIIGDAGYGVLICLGTMFVRRRLKDIPGEPFRLMYILGFSTIIWGTITGTWFGFEKITHIPFFNSLIIDRMNSFVRENQDFMIFICFTIGTIHLSIAHIMRFLRTINKIQSLSQLGWISILWGLYFLAGRLVLNRPFPNLAGYLLIAGISMVLIFTNFQKNILKGILLTLIDAPLAITGSFGDIVSYLRLFAVSSASLAISTTFNSFADFNNILKGFFSVSILVFAHSLNITMSFLSVIVHGIRLNMLEFSSHLGMQWSGIKYSPFSEE